MSRTRLARIAGLFYLLLAFCGIFADLYVRRTLSTPGDGAATRAAIAEHATLYRLAFVVDLLGATSYLILGLLLYRLLQHVHRQAAGAMVVFVAIGAGATMVNLAFHHAALLVATDPAYAPPGGADALVLLLTDTHHYGYVAAGVLFGLWLLPLGYLAYRSGLFPKALGVVLMAGCAGYLINTFGTFLAPDAGDTFLVISGVPAGIAEFWMVGYLLTVGVRSRGGAERAAAQPATVS